MNTDILVIVGVGATLFGLFWRMFYTLRRDPDAKIGAPGDRMGGVEQRLAHIEGWIQGRFNEGAAG